MEIWQIVLLVWVVVIPAAVLFLSALAARQREMARRPETLRLYVIPGGRQPSSARAEPDQVLRLPREPASHDGPTGVREPGPRMRVERRR